MSECRAHSGDPKDMGLTIHYTLAVNKGTTVRFIRDLLRDSARLARRLGCPKVGKVLHATESDPAAPPFFETHPGNPDRMFGGRGASGWLLEVWPGEGCETLLLGIVRERRELPRKRGRAGQLPRHATRWRLDSFCKTYYAAEHGIAHFVACHDRVIRLLDLWRERGARVRVDDEGGYWKSRSRERLAARVGRHEDFLRVAGQRVWT